MKKCLYSINIRRNIFISNDVSNFLWNILNPKTIKIFSAFTYKAIQWGPTDSYSSRFTIYVSSFNLDKLLLE